MTEIYIYPLWNIVFNFTNLAKYARTNNITITEVLMDQIDRDSQGNPTDGGALYHKITVSQTLSTGQKTAISNLFTGNAYVNFV